MLINKWKSACRPHINCSPYRALAYEFIKRRALVSNVQPGLYYQGYGGIDGVLAGSKHVFLLVHPDLTTEKVLHDCGNVMEDEEVRLGRDLPFRVDNLDSVVLSHGHFDHIGDVGKLPLNGYRGPFFGHTATKAIVEQQLTYQAQQQWIAKAAERIGEGDAFRKPRANAYPGREKPAFLQKHARQIMENFQGMRYETPFIPNGEQRGFIATLYDAGHIIGSSQVLYEVMVGDSKIKVLTCVDLGRSDCEVPLLRKPHTEFGAIDYCLIEATYGGKQHADRHKSREDLEELVFRGCRDGKRILIGAFSIMRTHAILSDLFWSYKRGKLPRDLVIYLDSPGAAKLNPVIMKHLECLSDSAQRDFRNRQENPFKFPNLRIVRDRKDSVALDKLRGPYVIISASGMWSMGRIVRHLANHVSDSNSLLVITGYQKPGCTGAQLEDLKSEIEIEGKTYTRRAEVVRIRSYGAHADGNDCVNHVVNHVRLRRGVFVVHGDTEPSEWMQRTLASKLDVPVEIVRKGRTYRLG